MNQNGKGSRPRRKSVNYKTWEKNYEKIFGKNKKISSRAIDIADTQVKIKEQSG